MPPGVAQAVQRETRQLGAEAIATDSVAPPERSSVTEWYGKNRSATRAALRLVYDAIEEVRTGGHVPIIRVDREYHTRRAVAIFRHRLPQFEWSVAAAPDESA